MYLFILKNKKYIPEVINIDYKKGKITFPGMTKIYIGYLKQDKLIVFQTGKTKFKSHKR